MDKSKFEVILYYSSRNITSYQVHMLLISWFGSEVTAFDLEIIIKSKASWKKIIKNDASYYVYIERMIL